jgi:hypothetical protein
MMSSSYQHAGSLCNLVLTGVLGCLLAGCSVVGPSAIRSGRIAYNEAITDTNNQQMLMIAIHDRYEESGSLLAVASVTANVRVVTNTGIQLGFGDTDDYAGNLVPFTGGVIYEENPTISYIPVAGEIYARQVFSPVPILVLAELTRSLVDPAPYYTALISSVNGIHNPAFMSTTAEPDPRFEHLVTLLTELTRARRLHWVKDLQQDGSLSIVVDRSPNSTGDVSELLRLLGLSQPDDPSAQVILPVFLALDGRDDGAIGITTRSVYEMVEILAAAIEVPEVDQQSGVATTYPAAGLVGQDLRVRYTDARPRHASVAVKYRDGWFYIDERDQSSKRFFRLLSSLWSVTIAASTKDATAAPVLTVPVSR